MVNVQKKLKNTGKVLAAFTTEKGMAIGAKNEGGMYVDAIVVIESNGDGTSTLYINQDKLDTIKGQIVVKNFDDDYVPVAIPKDMEGHTKYLQGVNLPIMINSVYSTEDSCTPSPVAEMHIGKVEGEDVLLITPESIGLPY